MKKGYLQSPGIIIWGPRKKRLLFTAYNEDEFYVNGDKLFDDSADSYYCPTCKKIIVEVDATGFEGLNEKLNPTKTHEMTDMDCNQEI